jgi:hypothetical protein
MGQVLGAGNRAAANALTSRNACVCTSLCLRHAPNLRACPPPPPQLGNSDNWKVCSSRLCAKKGAPDYNHADPPQECVFGGYRNKQALSPTFDDQGMCRRAQTCNSANCVGSCCPQTGQCPTSSCIANSLGTEERK